MRNRTVAAAAALMALSWTVSAAADDKPVFGLVMSFSGWFQPIDTDDRRGCFRRAA